MEDVADWIDSTLPDLYNPSMFDHEETADDVWEAVDAAIADTVQYTEDPDLKDQLQEAAANWFREHHDLVCESVPASTAEDMAALQAQPQTSQHSADWYAQRRNRLTASEFSHILDGRRGALLRSKIAPAAASGGGGAPVAISQPDGEMIATSWGHRFEPVVRDIFELEIAGVGTVCDTLGRFTHQTIPWLSASPDGVVLSGPLAGRLVEIKAPKSRQPGTFVPDEYWVQMQIQMEVCDREAVEFIEAQFRQLPATDADLEADAIASAPWKGRVNVYGFIDSPETWLYRYSRPVEDLEDLDLELESEANLLESSIWWLTGWFPRTVVRDRTWWASVGAPAATLFWSAVEAGRESQVQESEIAVTKEDVCNVWIGSD